MTRRLAGIFALSGLVLSGCVQGGVPQDETSQDETVGQSEQSMIRGTSGGRDQVVMLHIKKMIGGQLYTTTCSGTLFAQRVVVTAAHCLDNAIKNQVFAYFGDNYAADIGQLGTGTVLAPPPPGQPSNWAQADSFEQHPQWNAQAYSADLAVVYLDRKPPFDALPLGRFRLDNSWVGKAATITGWGADSTPTPTTGSGSRVERTGKTKILGSPTAADYHPEDPNPGMLDASVRQSVVKTDGRAPNANPCFGDSGSPLLVNQWGQDYIVGVSYFTGLSCEEYGLYTRIDPFLPFLDNAYTKGGQAVLKPTLDCTWQNLDGSYTAYFGYNNANGVSISVPYGTKNSFPKDTANRRPTKFLPGAKAFGFGVDFAAGDTLVYRLSPDNSPLTELRVTKASPRCSGAQIDRAEAGDYCRSLNRSGCTGVADFNSCLADWASWAGAAPACSAEYHALNVCYAGTPAGAENWTCIDDYAYPMANACGDVEIAYWDCLFANL